MNDYNYEVFDLTEHNLIGREVFNIHKGILADWRSSANEKSLNFKNEGWNVQKWW
jgi:hypothetical protein